MKLETSPDLRYPIGQFSWTGPRNAPEQRLDYIRIIEELPAKLRLAVRGLTEQQLQTPYRPGGWTVRQVVHHVPESHMNAYVRFKLALTEDSPTVKPYNEARWAELGDVSATPLETSLIMLDVLHQRWVLLLRSLSDPDFTRTFRHPEIGDVSLDKNLALYAWHSRHHTAHITSLRDRMRW